MHRAEGNLPIALGTAQLGMRYGIANRTGKPSLDEARKIVDAAWNLGIRWFDSAQAYGNSEAVLGKCLRDLGFNEGSRIVTKLHPRIEGPNEATIHASVTESRQRLGVDRLAALLLHNEDQLDQWSGPLGRTLLRVHAEGLCEQLGVSVYSPERALQALEIPELTVIQVPSNVFDRRFVRSGFFQRAFKSGRTVFVRSVFLQGLIFAKEAELDARLAFAREAVGVFQEYCRSINVSPAVFALDYARRNFNSSILLLGVESCEQLSQSVAAYYQGGVASHEVAGWDAKWSGDDETLVNPSRWPLS